MFQQSFLQDSTGLSYEEMSTRIRTGDIFVVLPLRHKKEFRQTVSAKTFQELEDSGSLLFYRLLKKALWRGGGGRGECHDFLLTEVVSFHRRVVAISIPREFSWVKSLFDKVDLILYDFPSVICSFVLESKP